MNDRVSMVHLFLISAKICTVVASDGNNCRANGLDYNTFRWLQQKGRLMMELLR